jgi:hypothetical protein
MHLHAFPIDRQPIIMINHHKLFLPRLGSKPRMLLFFCSFYIALPQSYSCSPSLHELKYCCFSLNHSEIASALKCMALTCIGHRQTAYDKYKICTNMFLPKLGSKPRICLLFHLFYLALPLSYSGSPSVHLVIYCGFS